jgi:hypothetical protein
MTVITTSPKLKYFSSSSSALINERRSERTPVSLFLCDLFGPVFNTTLYKNKKHTQPQQPQKKNESKPEKKTKIK